MPMLDEFSIRNAQSTEKALRWVTNQFPVFESPQDESEKMSTLLHYYTENGANVIANILNHMQADFSAIPVEQNGEIVITWNGLTYHIDKSHEDDLRDYLDQMATKVDG